MSQSIVESFKVLTTLAAYRVVSLDNSAANTVLYPASSARPMIGITVNEPGDTTGAVPVAVAGIAKLLFDDSVSCGSLVSADSSGRGIPLTAPSPTAGGGHYVGVALRTVNTTGTIAEVLIQPQHKTGALT